MNVTDSFAPSYAQARVKFLEAATLAGADIESLQHPMAGAEGETLALDVALDGAKKADKLLIISSGCHGVEGFCGSGVQVTALRDAQLRQAARDAGVALLYWHAINPYGFSYLRRVTQENVDLNRNFHDFSQAVPDNPDYAELHPLLLPEQWPPPLDNQIALGCYIAQHGMRAFQAAATRGQSGFADGLFYVGRAPTWSNDAVRRLLRRYGAHSRHIAWVDLHSGLGPTGFGERIYAGRPDPVAQRRAQAWWNPDGQTPVTTYFDDSAISTLVTRVMWHAAYDECRQAELTAMSIEYGTQNLEQVLSALRAEQWLQLHPQTDATTARKIKQDLRDAFYVDNETWKQQVVAQGLLALHQAVAGLAGVWTETAASA